MDGPKTASAFQSDCRIALGCWARAASGRRFTGHGGIVRFPNAEAVEKSRFVLGGSVKRGRDNRVQPCWSLEATNVETESAMAWVVSITVGVPPN